MYERHQQQQQQLLDLPSEQPTRTLPPRKRTKKSKNDNATESLESQFKEVLDWGKEVTQRSQDLERRAKVSLAKSDRQTTDLYKLNRKINDLFCKIIIEKSQKDNKSNNQTAATPSRNSIIAANNSPNTIAVMEEDLKLLREKHRALVRSSKKSLLQAKRLFTLAKRVADGYIKSEIEEAVKRFRKGCTKFIGKECAVCLDTISKGDRTLQVQQCQHVLHAECFDSWIELHTTCPVCRTQLEPDVNAQELPQQITDTISWAEMTTTNISAI